MGAGAEKYSRTYFIYDSTDFGVGVCQFKVDVFMEVDIIGYGILFNEFGKSSEDAFELWYN